MMPWEEDRLGGGGLPKQASRHTQQSMRLIIYYSMITGSPVPLVSTTRKEPLKQQLTALGPDSDAHGGGDGAASSTSSAGL